MRVEVVDAGDGKPVSGAEVLFCAAAEKVARTAQERAEYYQLTDFEVRARRFGASALTGSNGVAFLPRTAKGYDTVAARHGHRYGQAGADRDDDVVRIEVQADAMLRVQVVGPDGVGVEGVAVYAVLACCER